MGIKTFAREETSKRNRGVRILRAAQGVGRNEAGAHKCCALGLPSPTSTDFPARVHGDQAHLTSSFHTGPRFRPRLLLVFLDLTCKLVLEEPPRTLPSPQTDLLAHTVSENAIPDSWWLLDSKTALSGTT